MEVRQPRLLDQVRDVIRLKHYSIRTEQSYLHWIRRFILFHGKRHPREMGAEEVTGFLSDLAIRLNVAAATQNLALNAVLFLYREVLKTELPWLNDIQRAKKSQRLPVVFTCDEVKRLLAQLDGTMYPNAEQEWGWQYVFPAAKRSIDPTRTCSRKAEKGHAARWMASSTKARRGTNMARLLLCAAALQRPNSPSLSSRSPIELQERILELPRSSGGFCSSRSDHPPQPVSGRRGLWCNHARQTSEIVPALPPITMQASPAKAMSRLRASPMPQGISTLQGQFSKPISSDGTMLTTSPPAARARSAATRVAGLPHPLTRVTPRRASSSPAAPANS
jgi:hypothetical protein